MKTQIWIAVCSYLLVAIVRKQQNLEVKPSAMQQILSVSPFEKNPHPASLFARCNAT